MYKFKNISLLLSSGLLIQLEKKIKKKKLRLLLVPKVDLDLQYYLKDFSSASLWRIARNVENIFLLFRY